MNNTQTLLLLTRPIDHAQRDADYFAQHNINCALAPMLEYENINFDNWHWSGYEGIVITSAQALKAIQNIGIPTDTSVFCVGDQTAATAKNNGFNNVFSANGTAQDLIELIKIYIKKNNLRSLLYLRGYDISVDILDALQNENIKCDSLICYKAQQTQNITQNVLTLITQNKIKAIAFYSRRSAANFDRLVRVHNIAKHLKTIKALCLSDNVLECVQALDWAQIYVSPQADGQKFKEFIIKTLN